MSWDYYIDRTQQLESDASELKGLLESLEQAKKDKVERQKLKQKIEEKLSELSNKLTMDHGRDPSKIFAAKIVDDVTIWWFQEWALKEDVRERTYIRTAQSVKIGEPGKVHQNLDFRPDLMNLPTSTWLGLQVDFELLTPWYSKDDRVFHFLDNPVHKDRIFGMPFMSAASWKGMLRWACRMQAGLRKHLEEGKPFRGWEDPNWILHLFGNEKGEEKDFHQGALVFYPTWFDRIGFQVINPHSRERRAGTQPIYYEVVPPDAKGTLYLLYAPWPGMSREADPRDALPRLLKAIEDLLTTYGISAKRTVGWGTAKITKWKAFRKGQQPVEHDDREQLWRTINAWFHGGGTP